MKELVSPFIPFPAIGWWVHAIGASKIIFDESEHFRKMTDRNRYKIAGANNAILLTIPLENGREQRIAMGDATIFNKSGWQTQHWRTLVSAYRRSPFFDHYEPGLSALYEQHYHRLVDFNRATIEWVARQLSLKMHTEVCTEYRVQYPPHVIDLRSDKKWPAQIGYRQVFEDRNGFIEGLSILDLLFAEGPTVLSLLKTASNY